MPSTTLPAVALLLATLPGLAGATPMTPGQHGPGRQAPTPPAAFPAGGCDARPLHTLWSVSLPGIGGCEPFTLTPVEGHDDWLADPLAAIGGPTSLSDLLPDAIVPATGRDPLARPEPLAATPAVPEPRALALLGAGLLAFLGSRRRTGAAPGEMPAGRLRATWDEPSARAMRAAQRSGGISS